MRKSVHLKGLALLALLILTCGIWYAAIREDRGGGLTVSFLRVKAGDAIFIDTPSGRQVLIDGGPDGGVLRELGALIPPWDRTLDIVLASSANPDYFSGLADVLQRYSVGLVVQTGVSSTNGAWNAFEKEAAMPTGGQARLPGQGTHIVSARRGQVFDTGGGVYLEVLFPDRSTPDVAAPDGCVITRLIYGKTSFLFVCNASLGVQNYLAMLDGTKLKSDVLFIGTKNVSPILLGYVNAQFVASTSAATFVSDGKIVSKL